MRLETVRLADAANGIVVLTMDHPPANAFSDRLHDDMLAALDHLAERGVRVLVITGVGRFFQAGGEMSRFLTLRSREEAELFVSKAQAFMDRIAGFPAATIAAINGFALGGGLEIALACDVRVAAPDARVGLPEARFGILAGAGGTQRLARLVGPGRAKLLMFTARQWSAAEACAIGLVDVVAPPGRLLEHVLDLAREIATNSPRAVRQIKRCVDEGASLELSRALELERKLWVELVGHGDHLEGVAAWLEKRSPAFPDEAPGMAGWE